MVMKKSNDKKQPFHQFENRLFINDYISIKCPKNDMMIRLTKPILSFEEGKTLFDCVLQGIHIPEQVIIDVENAREYVQNGRAYYC